MSSPIRIAATAACAALLVVACRRDNVDRVGEEGRVVTTERSDRSGVSETTVTGAVAPVSNDGAILRLVAARCSREQACKNIGSDKHFTSFDTCSAELRGRMVNELSSTDCPRGIDAKGLESCMESIRTEDCNNPVDTITRFASCRTSALCLKLNAGP